MTCNNINWADEIAKEEARMKEFERIPKLTITVLTILDKYGKLKGTAENPLFSDRECAREIVGVIINQ